jgi:glycosyltransferase involved in cell wall biosynthesis
VGRWAARLARVPLIVHTFHGFGFSERHSWLARNLYLAIERLNRRISDELVVVASQHLEQGRQWGILSEGKGRLIRSGVDFSALKGRVSLDEKKVELGIGKSDRIVGVVASMTPAKSLDLFVRAARTIKDRCPEARFLMVGEGVLRPALESQIRSAGLGDAFLLLGWRRDVPEIIPLFDVALLTSRWEGVPKFLIEASALGVPTVAFNIDGVSEVIREGANGFLVNPENVTELARKALLILEDHALRERMGAAGRFLVEEFSAKRMVQLHETLYEELLEGLSSRGK